MARVHRSYRLEESVIERVTAWAEEHHTTTTTAIEVLLTRAMESDDTDRAEESRNDDLEDLRRQIEILESQAEAWRAQRTTLGDYIATLKESTYLLKEQLMRKDEQISRLQDTVEHAQALEAARVGRSIEASDHPKGVWGWLAAKAHRKELQ